MAKQPHLGLRRDFEWRNWHATSGVGGTVRRFYTAHNRWADGTRSSRKGFLPGLAGLRRVVAEAEDEGLRVRALGSGWSLSQVAFTPDCLINTSRLAYHFVGFRSETMVQPSFRDRKDRLVFAQCGTTINVLNASLESRGLALPTSGASNGQTIAGAISTGTHGSAVSVGAMHDSVLGLHLVLDGGRHIWLQPSTDPACAESFAEWLGAELVEDDALFRASLVSFGSFGVIHGVLFEASPLSLLERVVVRRPFATVEAALTTLDLDRLDLPHGLERPFHLEIVLNPYRLHPQEEGAFVRALYRRPVDGALPSSRIADTSTLNGEDLVSIAGAIGDALPALLPGVLQGQLEDAFEPFDGSPILGTPGQQFSSSSPTGGGASVEIGVALGDARRALDAILRVTRSHPFGAPISFRYVKGSRATLAFTKFKPISCAIELPGVDSFRSRDAHQRIFQQLRGTGIRHTYHWGQAHPMNPTWVREGFGSRAVNAWLAARRTLLGSIGRHMFANSVLEQSGLAEP